VGHHSWWTGPVATVVLFALAIAGLGLVAALLRRLDRLWAAATWVFGFLAAFAMLYSFPQIQRLAALVLSAAENIASFNVSAFAMAAKPSSV